MALKKEHWGCSEVQVAGRQESDWGGGDILWDRVQRGGHGWLRGLTTGLQEVTRQGSGEESEWRWRCAGARGELVGRWGSSWLRAGGSPDEWANRPRWCELTKIPFSYRSGWLAPLITDVISFSCYLICKWDSRVYSWILREFQHVHAYCYSG
jgi:hypothetical protein